MVGWSYGGKFCYDLFYNVRYKWVSPVVMALLHMVVLVSICVGPLPRHDLYGIAGTGKEAYRAAEDASGPHGVAVVQNSKVIVFFVESSLDIRGPSSRRSSEVERKGDRYLPKGFLELVSVVGLGCGLPFIDPCFV